MTIQLTERPRDTTTDLDFAVTPPAAPAGTDTTGSGGSHVPPSFTQDPERPGGSPSPWSRRLAAGLLALGLAVGSGTAGALAVTSLEGTGTSTASATPSTATSSSASSGATSTSTAATSSLPSVVAKVTPSVVAVLVGGRGSGAEGSGIVLRSDGLVLTNNHVVAAGSGSTITVEFSDGRTAPATVVGTDASSDLAIIKVSGVSGLTVASLGSSSALAVGDEVLAVGNPLGLSDTVTSGIVSALDRTITVSGDNGSTETLRGAIQTDAAINPGNSGGALVDAGGAVVGITTASASLSGQDSGSIGVGFAIPIDSVKQVVARILASA